MVACALDIELSIYSMSHTSGGWFAEEKTDIGPAVLRYRRDLVVPSPEQDR